jgi:hypothetical protein
MSDHEDEAHEGGDPACYAHLLCPQCGVVLDGDEHRPGCTWLAETFLTNPVE